MNKSRLNILVVEDDLSQSKALSEAFTRQGYSTVVCNSSVQALSQAQRMEFHCLIVDCMLPKMNGVDLVEEIVPLMPAKPKVFLFSGIFKDREFMHDAVERTGAEAFLFKPINLAELLERVEQSLLQFVGPVTPTLMKLYGSENFTDESLIKLIESEPTAHAFHLPMLYQRILQTTLSGELTLISANGDISTVSFFEGHVFSVKTPDKDSYFGSLAVSHGFVSPEEVMEALSNPAKKPIGEKLIGSMSLSPHAIHVIVQGQLALRLSQTVHDDVVSLQWVSQKFAKPEVTLPEAKFESLVEDWLSSKFTNDWIKSTLMSWGAFQIEGDFHSDIRGKPTIEDLFANSRWNAPEELQAVFRALALGRAFMGSRGEETKSFKFLESRLDQMNADFKHQNYFQILGLNDKAQAREVNRAYEGLKEAFDPAMLPEACPAQLREKCKVVFTQIEKARTVLVDDTERMRYLQKLQSQRNQELLEAEPVFRAAVLEVMSGHYAQAAKKFQKLIDRKLDFKDLKAYRLWAGLKSDRDYDAIRLDQIPPEERHSTAYLMAKGIYYRRKGQYKNALEAFRTAHVLDPRSRAAKHELKHIVTEINKQKNPNRELLREVTSIVENIFSKKGA